MVVFSNGVRVVSVPKKFSSSLDGAEVSASADSRVPRGPQGRPRKRQHDRSLTKQSSLPTYVHLSIDTKNPEPTARDLLFYKVSAQVEHEN